jgi:hypothetical protein
LGTKLIFYLFWSLPNHQLEFIFSLHKMKARFLFRKKETSQTLISELFHFFQVTEIICYLNKIKFAIDPREATAGKAISQLLHQIDSTDEIKLKTLQEAASNLNLTSQKTLLIEKRSIRKLLDEVAGKNPEKEHILNFLYNLLQKHARNVKPVDTKTEQNQSDQRDESRMCTCETLEPDDVNIHLVSSLENRFMSHLEGKDENNENPIPKTFKEANEALLQVLFPWSRDYVETGSFSGFNRGKFLNFFKDLAGLETEKRNKAVEDVVVLLERDVDTCYLMLSNGFGEALIEFLGMPYQLSDTVAQEVGAQLFLAYLRNNRYGSYPIVVLHPLVLFSWIINHLKSFFFIIEVVFFSQYLKSFLPQFKCHG